MKKIKVLVLLLVMVTIITGCGKKSNSVNLKKTREDKLGAMSYKMPEAYVVDKDFSDEEMVFYDVKDKSIEADCGINIARSNTYDFALKALFDERSMSVSYFNEKSQSKKIKKNDWVYATHKDKKEDENGKYSIVYLEYGITHADEFYMISVTSYNDSKDCSKLLDNLVESVKFE